MSSDPGEALARARGVRLAIFDVDGVMTDGTLYIGAAGDSFVAFNILDGHGLKRLKEAGVAVAILTGRSTEAVAQRAKDLEIEHVVQGAKDKVREFEKLRARLAVPAEACSFMGDDLQDLGVMRLCGLAASVPNAVEEVRQAAHYVTRARGGSGAVREFCEMVLRAQGRAAAPAQD